MSTSYKKERNKSYYSNCFIPKNDLCIQYKIVEIKENTNDIGHYYFAVLKRKKKTCALFILYFCFLTFRQILSHKLVIRTRCQAFECLQISVAYKG